MNADHQTNIERFSHKLKFVAIDIETTGLNHEKDEIIEVAAIKFEKGAAIEKYESFIKPKKDLPKFIQYLTHISPAQLKNAPPAGVVLKELRSFIGDSTIVGHNIGFDTGFINQNLIRTGELPLANRNWDTADLSRIYFPFTSDHKLSTMVDEFGIVLENAHRANADAEATGILLIKMVDYIIEHYSLILNARLLDLSRQAQYSNSISDLLAMVVEHQRRNSLIGIKPKAPLNEYRNIIEHVTQDTTATLDEVFGIGGLFDKKFQNYEYRRGQMDMADQIQTAMNEKSFLVVEAGTGVGKSFAYLIPAIMYSLRNNSKVVVSTNTKNLQEQLFFKDLPLLKDIIPMSFKAVLVKGRENYICERRWQELLLEQTKGLSTYDAQALLNLLVWKSLTHTGDVSENSSFDKSRNSISWRKVCSDRYLCHNRKCQFFGSCHVMSLRKQIENASIVVVNHSLLLADLKADNTTLGEYSHLVIDEAHNLMSSASKHLGFDISYADMITLLNHIGSAHKRKNTGFLHLLEQNISKSLIADAAKEQIANLDKNIYAHIEALKKPITELFNQSSKLADTPDSYGKFRIKDCNSHRLIFDVLADIIKLWKEFIKDIRALSNVLGSVSSKQVPNYDMLKESLEGFELRASDMEGLLLILKDPDLDENALWVESNQSSDKNYPSSLICYAPIEVNRHLNNILYKNVASVVFTSATLALRGSFKYFTNLSGLNLIEEKKLKESIVESPFDFEKQSRLMIASFLPEHKDMFYTNQALSCLEEVVGATDVGTMLLFTSYRDLNSVYEHLGDMLYHKNRPFFAQGKGGSRTSILKEFKKSSNAVLLGTNSFWEGVDIQGKSLSLLILYKLPFLVPSEPIVEAYIDKLERDNHDSFMHYMLPNALLKLRQGFGRLIRSKSDTGIVLIMDSRVSKKKYGEYFKQVLPTKCIELKDPIQLVTEISTFFRR